MHRTTNTDLVLQSGYLDCIWYYKSGHPLFYRHNIFNWNDHLNQMWIRDEPKQYLVCKAIHLLSIQECLH